MLITLGSAPNTKSLLPKFDFGGGYELEDEGKDGITRNWNMTISESGTFTPERDMTVDVFLCGGGAAGNKDGLGGGGGYTSTLSGVQLTKGTAYPLVIGTGGTASGAAGGQTSGFGGTANGGSGGVAGTPSYIQCTMSKTTGSGVYVYGGTNVTTYERILASGTSVQLACDSNGNFVTATITVSGSSVSCYRGYDGKYYRGSVDGGSYYTVYTSGSTGTGGSATQVFGTGDTVSGAGADSGTANGSRPGQGGAGNGAYGGSAFGRGANGLIAIRNAR